MDHKNKQKVCENCGAIMVSHDCIVCGAKNGKRKKSKKQVDGKDMAPPSVNKMYSQRIFTRAFTSVLIVLVIISSLSVITLEYLGFKNLSKLYNTDGALVYQQSNNYLKFFSPNLSTPVIIDRYYYNNTNEIQLSGSQDKRFIAYMGNQHSTDYGYEGSLILLDLTKLKDKKATSGLEKIFVSEQEAKQFFFIPNKNHLVYLTTKGELYLCDYSNAAGIIPRATQYNITIIDVDVQGILDVAEGSLVYYKGGDDSVNLRSIGDNQGKTFDLYKSVYNKGKITNELIDRNVFNLIANNDNLSKLIYTKRENGTKKLSAYVIDYTKQPKLLAKEVDRFVDVDIQNNAVVYLTKIDKTFKINDFLEDSFTIGDSQLGSKEDFEELLKTENNFTEDYIQAQRKLFEEKDRRDELRKKIGELVEEINKSSIYYRLSYAYDSNESTRVIGENVIVVDGVDTIQSNLSEGHILYISNPTEKIEKLSISRLTDEQIKLILEPKYSYKELIFEQLAENLMVYSTQSNIVKNIFSEKGDKIIDKINIDNTTKNIYFISKAKYNNNSGTLYSVPYINSEVGQIVYIDDYVSDIVGQYSGKTSGLIYQTASKDQPPEYIIYNYTSSGIIEVDYDTSDYSHVDILGKNNNLLFYFKDQDISSNAGDLYLYESQENPIAQGVMQYEPMDNGKTFAVVKSNNVKIYYIQGDIKREIDSKIGLYKTFTGDFEPDKDK